MYNITNLFILALVAAVVIFRLWTSLGRYESEELNIKVAPELKIIEPIEVKPGNDDLPQQIGALQELDEKSIAELENIMKLEESFNPSSFLKKASSAFEYILDLYCKQNIDELRTLVSPDVLASFEKQISELKKSSSMLKIVIISISAARFKEIKTNGKTATIKIAFESHQIEYKTDQSGNIISGNSSNVFKKNDFWTFSKELGGESPNWRLIST